MYITQSIIHVNLQVVIINICNIIYQGIRPMLKQSR